MWNINIGFFRYGEFLSRLMDRKQEYPFFSVNGNNGTAGSAGSGYHTLVTTSLLFSITGAGSFSSLNASLCFQQVRNRLCLTGRLQDFSHAAGYGIAYSSHGYSPAGFNL
jgi:hypothetical protein